MWALNWHTHTHTHKVRKWVQSRRSKEVHQENRLEDANLFKEHRLEGEREGRKANNWLFFVWLRRLLLKVDTQTKQWVVYYTHLFISQYQVSFFRMMSSRWPSFFFVYEDCCQIESEVKCFWLHTFFFVQLCVSKCVSFVELEKFFSGCKKIIISLWQPDSHPYTHTHRYTHSKRKQHTDPKIDQSRNNFGHGNQIMK